MLANIVLRIEIKILFARCRDAFFADAIAAEPSVDFSGAISAAVSAVCGVVGLADVFCGKVIAVGALRRDALPLLAYGACGAVGEIFVTRTIASAAVVLESSEIDACRRAVRSDAFVCAFVAFVAAHAVAAQFKRAGIAFRARFAAAIDRVFDASFIFFSEMVTLSACFGFARFRFGVAYAGFPSLRKGAVDFSAVFVEPAMVDIVIQTITFFVELRVIACVVDALFVFASLETFALIETLPAVVFVCIDIDAFKAANCLIAAALHAAEAGNRAVADFPCARRIFFRACIGNAAVGVGVEFEPFSVGFNEIADRLERSVLGVFDKRCKIFLIAFAFFQIGFARLVVFVDAFFVIVEVRTAFCAHETLNIAEFYIS